jgi:hypothetical protein
MTSREKVIAAAKARGLEVFEDGRRVSFGYFQVSFTDAGGWWSECAHGPRFGPRPSLAKLLHTLREAPDSVLAPPREDLWAKCSCARNSDGSVTTMMCPTHAEQDPCETMAQVTGRRRKRSIVGGVCTACGWSHK